MSLSYFFEPVPMVPSFFPRSNSFLPCGARKLCGISIPKPPSHGCSRASDDPPREVSFVRAIVSPAVTARGQARRHVPDRSRSTRTVAGQRVASGSCPHRSRCALLQGAPQCIQTPTICHRASPPHSHCTRARYTIICTQMPDSALPFPRAIDHLCAPLRQVARQCMHHGLGRMDVRVTGAVLHAWGARDVHGISDDTL
jgi:hypothetical protein